MEIVIEKVGFEIDLLIDIVVKIELKAYLYAVIKINIL